jgi:hypothetical protein
MSRIVCILLLSGFLNGLRVIAATHDVDALAVLFKEANDQNSEIKEAVKSYESFAALKSRARAPYFPEFGLEGGVESHRNLNQGDASASGGFLYAFGRYNLYRGRSDYYGLEERSKEEDFAEFRLNKVKARIQREVSQKYYELVFLQEAIKLKELAVRTNSEQSQMAEKRSRSGITSEADVLEFELRDATLRSDLLLFQQEKNTAMKELDRLIGRDTNDESLVLDGELVHAHMSRPLGEFLSIAEKENESLGEAKKNFSVASLEHSATLSGWLPKVDVEANYGALARADRTIPSTPALGVLLKVTLPLFSGFESYYERTVKAREMERSEVAVYRFRQQTKVQIENAYTRLKTVEARVDLEERNLDRAKRYYDITLSEYKRGIKNSPDLSGAAEKLFDTRLRILQYKRDFYLGRISLAEAIGIADI